MLNTKSPPKSEVTKKIQYQKTNITHTIPRNVNETPCKTDYSHILSVIIQNSVTHEKKVNNDLIYKEIAKILHNVVHTKMLGNNLFIPITWVQQGSIFSNKYYMKTELFGDVAVQRHTVLLLQDVIQQIDVLFDNTFSKKETVLIFEVTKPLMKKEALL